MSVPGIVQSTLDGEEIAARVSLGGDDELFVSASSTIIYRAEGLLSDESVEEFPHDADRLTLSKGRRKTRFSLEYPLDGVREFTVPASTTESVLHPVLAGVLNGNGITEAGETVAKTYQFSELTLIVTDNRLVKHIGEAVWDGDFEQYHYADVTNLSFEEGSVATQIVLTVDGRPERIKAPNEEADDVAERLKRALFAFHGVDSLEALNEALGGEEADAPREDPAVAFGSGVDPLEAGSTAEDADAGDSNASDRDGTSVTARAGVESTSADRTASASAADGRSTEPEREARAGGDDGFADSGFQPATSADTSDDAAEAQNDLESDVVLERLGHLETVVEAQTAEIERQRETIERLIAELRQGR